mgnify:CR=1 FL=1
MVKNQNLAKSYHEWTLETIEKVRDAEIKTAKEEYIACADGLKRKITEVIIS